MSTVFDISPEEIERLNEHAFVDVMNKLLWAESTLLGIPPANIKTSLRIYDPDGGIDAQIIPPLGVQNKWIPEDETVWQFKSGDITTKSLKKELEKKDVKEAIQRGATYCLAIGKDVVPKKLNKLEEHLKKYRTKHKVYNASHIAEWASKIPSIRLLPYFQHLGGLMRLEEWARLGFVTLPFVPDKQREGIIPELRQKLVATNEYLHIRVEGLPGVGKTRVVYEALNVKGLKELVAYAKGPEDVPKQFLVWVRSNNAKLVLVVDECDPNEVGKFEDKVNLCEGKVRLITIGKLASSTSLPSNVYRLDPLDRQTTEEIIKKAFPGIPNETARFVATNSSGYIKLAELLAKALITNPSLRNATQLAQSYDVSRLLEGFLPEDRRRKALKAIAILNRVGWEGELAKEGETVARFIDISWKELQDVAGEMLRNGIVVKKGRYRFVTPHLLAVWLAAEVWEDRGRSTLDLLEQLPTTLGQEAFLERLESLAGNATIEKVIRDEGFFEREFPDFKSIDNELSSNIFGKLAICYPKGALEALQRILEPLSLDELKSSKNGRRHVVWALQKLAWLPETFEGAVRLLLKLAVAENENYATNATGIWCQLFRICLSGTSVPVLKRHYLIKEALMSEQVEFKLLGVKAISSTLVTRNFSRSTSGELQGGRIVPHEYFPKTWGEVGEIIASTLQLWDEAFSNSNEIVSEASGKALLNNTRGLVSSGFFEEVIQRVELLKSSKEHLRWEARRTLQDVLEYEGKFLEECQKDRVEKLIEEFAGSSYKERLRRWIGRLTYQDRDWKGNKHIEMTKSLAEEGYNNPALLKSEIEWLTSKEAENIWSFAKHLGELDKQREWLRLIEPFVREGQGQVFFAAYMNGRKNAGDTEWVDSMIDSYIEKNRLMASAVLKTIETSEPNPSGVKRLITLVEKGWLEPISLGAFAWGKWPEMLPRESFCKLLKTLLKDDGEQASLFALEMLESRIKHVKDEEFKDLVFEVLARPSALHSSKETMLDWLWGELAGRYVSLDPIRLADIIVSSLLFPSFELLDDYKLKVLVEATKLSPKEILWEVVGPILLKNDEISRGLLYELGGLYGFGETLLFNNYAELIGADIAIDWAEKHKPQGPRILAHLTCIGDEKGLSPVARELIVKFAGDEEVISTLNCHFFSGGWRGSKVSYLESKLKAAKVWSEDPHPKIKKFAEELVNELKEDIERARLAEEEDKY